MANYSISDINGTDASLVMVYPCWLIDADHIYHTKDPSFVNLLVGLIALNGGLSVIATFTNLLVISTICQTPSLRKPSNFLIVSLSASDLIVGLVSQPAYCIKMFAEMSRIPWLYCDAGQLFTITTVPLATISFLTVSTVIADRFTAVVMHLRYQEFVTVKRVIFAALLIWIMGAGFGTFYLILRNQLEVFMLGFALFALVLAMNVFFVVKITLVIRHHSRQICEQLQATRQHATNNARPDMPSVKKSIILLNMVIIAFVICYMPYGVLRTAMIVTRRVTLLNKPFKLSETLIFINGVINPFIYFFRMREMRLAAVQLLKRLFLRPSCPLVSTGREVGPTSCQ